MISVSTPAISNHGNTCTLNVGCNYSMSDCVSGVCSCMAGYSFDGGTNSCIIVTCMLQNYIWPFETEMYVQYNLKLVS